MANMTYDDYSSTLAKREASLSNTEAKLTDSISSSAIRGANSLFGLDSQFNNYQSSSELNTLNLNYGISNTGLGLSQFFANADLGFAQRESKRQFGLDQSAIELGSLERLTSSNLDLIDTNTNFQLQGALNKLDLSNTTSSNSIAGLKEQRGLLKQSLSHYDNVEGLLNERFPLYDQLQRSQIGRSQLSQEALTQRARGVEFQTNRDVALTDIVGNVVNYYGGSTNLLTSDISLDKKVEGGVSLSGVLSKIDQESLQQRQIVTNTILRKNQTKESIERVKIGKLNVKTRISQANTRIKNLIAQQDYNKKMEGLLKSYHSKKSAIQKDILNEKLTTSKELNKLFSEYQSRLGDIDKISTILSKGFRQSKAILDIAKLQEEYKIKQGQLKQLKSVNRTKYAIQVNSLNQLQKGLNDRLNRVQEARRGVSEERRATAGGIGITYSSNRRVI